MAAPAMPSPPPLAAHDFEKHHFSSPRWCDTCGEFIWGLGKQGYKCKTCAYSCHSKCRNGADACGARRTKNAEKGKGLSLAVMTPGGPPYVHTLPNFSGFATKEEHPLFSSLEGKELIRIAQLGGQGSITDALKTTAQIATTVGSLAGGEFEEEEEEEGEEKGEGGEKGAKTSFQYEAYCENWSTKVFHITANVQKPKKSTIVFKKEKKGEKKKKEPKVHDPNVDPLKAKEEKKKKKMGLISATFKKNKYAVSVGGKHIADIRKHPHGGALKTFYQVLGPDGTVILDAKTNAVAEINATYKVSPPNSEEKIGEIQRLFKAVHLYKDGSNVYKIRFPKYASLDVKAILLALTLVLDVEEYPPSGSVVQKTGGLVGVIGNIAKIAGAGGE